MFEIDPLPSPIDSDEAVFVSSPGYPVFDCGEASWLITCISTNSKTCMIEYDFLDFDLPPNYKMSVSIFSMKVFKNRTSKICVA